ncbi:MAG: cytochrome c [Nitrospirota bacterium]
MSIFFLKSILSIVMLPLAGVAMFTMFKIFGKVEKRYNIEKLKKIHRVNGIIYILIFALIAYFCLSSIVLSQYEMSARSAFHSIFALTILVLLAVKISIIKIYRQFYNQVKVLGLLIALITFGLVGTSGGYYFVVTKFGTEKTFDKAMEYKKKGTQKTEEKDGGTKSIVRTDPESIRKGKELYESKCYFCHEAYSTKTTVGPGHKGIMKNPLFPASRKPATLENVAEQIRNPYKDMPSFSYLSEEDVMNLISFLNTL